MSKSSHEPVWQPAYNALGISDLGLKMKEDVLPGVDRLPVVDPRRSRSRRRLLLPVAERLQFQRQRGRRDHGGGVRGTGAFISSAKCAGSQDAMSALVDYKLVKRLDLYAGVMVSNVYGGMANGYWNNQWTYNPATRTLAATERAFTQNVSLTGRRDPLAREAGEGRREAPG